MDGPRIRFQIEGECGNELFCRRSQALGVKSGDRSTRDREGEGCATLPYHVTFPGQRIEAVKSRIASY